MALLYMQMRMSATGGAGPFTQAPKIPNQGAGDTVTRLVIDTSLAGATVGADPAEGLAILLALLDPEVSLEGVILTGGDLHIKAAHVRRLYEVCGRSAPLALGATHDLLGQPSHDASLRPPTVRFLSDHRAVAGLPRASELLLECVAGTGDVTLVALGRPTTTALALLTDPPLGHRLHRIVLGGCSVGLPLRPEPDASDPHAAAVVLRMAAGRVIVSDPSADLPVGLPARQLALDGDTASSELAELVAEYCQSWLAYHERDWLPLDGALSLIGIAHPELREMVSRRYLVDPCARSFGEMLLPLDDQGRHPRPVRPGQLHAIDTMTSYHAGACIGLVESLLELPAVALAEERGSDLPPLTPEPPPSRPE